MPALLLFLTKHDGSVSLKRIKRTLPFAILCLLLKSQLAIFIGLHREADRRQSVLQSVTRAWSVHRQ